MQAITKTKGWHFPPAFSPSEGVKIDTGDDCINSAMKVLLSTQEGERIINPDYGNGLHSLIFTNIDNILASAIRSSLFKSVQKFEPRVNIEDIHISSVDVSTVNVSLTYTTVFRKSYLLVVSLNSENGEVSVNE